jgi:hypothetical protein
MCQTALARDKAHSAADLSHAAGSTVAALCSGNGIEEEPDKANFRDSFDCHEDPCIRGHGNDVPETECRRGYCREVEHPPE